MGSAPRVRVFRQAGAVLPAKATSGAAGFDVCARLDPDLEWIEIAPGDRATIPTGLFFEIPPDYFISLRPRSGLALKQGLTLLNAPATIDSDYRGELRVLLINLGHEPARIRHGDRIAQALLEKVVRLEWEEVESREIIGETDRGGGGFGSTGVGGSMLA